MALKRAGVPFALAGGFAAYARGCQRSTNDVDFVLPETAAPAARWDPRRRRAQGLRARVRRALRQRVRRTGDEGLRPPRPGRRRTARRRPGHDRGRRRQGGPHALRPTDETLVGEPPEIWPFLGNYLLGEAIDRAGVDLAVHGHAHAGCERGLTAGGTRVRNVAQPIIRTACAVYTLQPATPGSARAATDLTSTDRAGRAGGARGRPPPPAGPDPARRGPGWRLCRRTARTRGGARARRTARARPGWDDPSMGMIRPWA